MTRGGVLLEQALIPDRFAEFVAALHDSGDGHAARTPFPWQRRLVEQVFATGRWPDLLDLPTASGKTTTIEIALYLMAAGVRMPRRIVLVVDRRIIVSQAAAVADNAASRLRPDAEGILGEVARGLRRLAPGPDDGDAAAPVLNWAELRGGISRDEQWATRPDVPAVVVSTVDQVGSRLLFRGYGVSDRMKPIHAGLLGTDCLFLLDEVHLSRPFADTLRAIGTRYLAPASVVGDGARWRVVELSATPSGSTGADRFGLGGADRDAAVTPVLARRLAAHKPARMVTVPTRGKDEAAHRRALAAQAAKEAAALVTGPDVTAVGVIVNRVDTAREVRRLLADDDRFDTELLTGRMRGFDRDDLLSRTVARVAMGRVRAAGDRPLVLVATQAVEAGADFDLDAVVTECASLDALQQRFGRVRRDGVPEEPIATSVIMATAAAIAAGADDPVYGTSLATTWQLLTASPQPLDLGADRFAELRASAQAADIAAASPERERSPVLLPRTLDLWSQTSQRPFVDPDPALWLHGLVPPRPEVSVVWRADLPDLRRPLGGGFTLDAGALADLADLVGLVPPGSGESISLPLPAVAGWLEKLVTRRDDRRAIDGGSIADVDVGAESVEERGGGQQIAPVLRWEGDQSSLAAWRRELRPGDVLVVPAVYGGIGHRTFDPDATEPVADLASQVAASQRRRAVLRLRSDLLPAALTGGGLPEPDADGSPADDRVLARAWLTEAGDRLSARDGDGVTWRAVVSSLSRDVRTGRRSVVRRVTADGAERPYLVLVGTSLLPRDVGSAEADTVDEDAPEMLERPVSMAEHLTDVGVWAERLARGCGLPEAILDDLVLAGRVHDIGKADPRFQTILAGGLPPAREDPLLAKSGDSPDLARRRELARQAGYPSGTRHEMTSVAMLTSAPDLLAGAHDVDLVLHLVASHHGRARPFAPVVADTSTARIEATISNQSVSSPVTNELYRLGSGIADRFWSCTRKYGWYGLAYLEAVLRLADHRASESEQATTGSEQSR